MFSIEERRITSAAGVNVGVEFILSGELVYGTPIKEYEALKKMTAMIGTISISDLIVLNVAQLNRWDSLGVAQTVGPIIQTNQRLLARGRKPIPLIGDKKKDVYRAVKDKYPQLVESPQLPWFDSTAEFLQEVGIV